jgi:hypothetical protein
MALWNNPPRTLATLLDRLTKDIIAFRSGNVSEITVERVTAIFVDGTVEVRGAKVPISGVNPGIRAGQLVHVSNENGKPKLVLAHSARRAKFPAVSQLLEGGVIEELFSFVDPNTGLTEIYFRNDEQVTNLNVRSVLPSGFSVSTPTWGLRDDTFLMNSAGSKFAVLKLNRNAGQLLGSTTARVTLVKTVDLTQLTATPVISFTIAVGKIGGGPDLTTLAVSQTINDIFTSAQTFILADGIRTVTITVALSPGGTVLDHRLNIISAFETTTSGHNDEGVPKAYGQCRYTTIMDIETGQVFTDTMRIFTNAPARTTPFGIIGRTDTHAIRMAPLVTPNAGAQGDGNDLHTYTLRAGASATALPILAAVNIGYLNDINSDNGAGSDPILSSDYILLPNGSEIAIVPLHFGVESVPTTVALNSRHLMWRAGSDINLTTYSAGNTVKVGTDPGTVPDPFNDIFFLETDFAYRYNPPDPTIPTKTVSKILNIWNFDSGTFSGTQGPGFPEDPAMKSLVALKDLPAGVDDGNIFQTNRRVFHVVDNSTVLSPIGRFKAT